MVGVTQPFLFECGHFLVLPMCHSASCWISFRGNCSIWGVHGRWGVQEPPMLCLQPRIAHLIGCCRQREESTLKGRKCSEGNHLVGSCVHFTQIPVFTTTFSLFTLFLHPTLSNSYSENSIFQYESVLGTLSHVFFARLQLQQWSRFIVE